MGKNRKPKKDIPQSLKQKNPKNKKTKVILVFDEEKREKFLTGFSKRKNERRKRAQEEMEEKIKKEKRKQREKHRDLMKRAVPSKKCQPLPDFEEIVESEKYDLQTHTVTVTDVSDVDFVGTGGLRLGMNQDAEEEDEAPYASTKKPTEAEKRTTAKLLKPKRNFTKSKHTNYTHTVGRRKHLSVSEQKRVKRKLKKVEKRLQK